MMNQHYGCLFNNKYGLHYEFDQYGYAWFLASELAHYLGYSEIHNMTKMCDRNETIVLTINNPIVSEIGLDMSGYIETSQRDVSVNGGARRFTIIHESGVYRIAMNARTDRKEVNDFRDWVLRELLPGVRMTGVYIAPEMEDQLMQNPEQIRQIIDENRKLRHQVGLRQMYHLIDKSQYPYREYEEMKRYEAENEKFINTGKAVYNNGQNITINELAGIITQNINPNIGEVGLRGILRSERYLSRSIKNFNKPTKTAIKNGYIAYIDNGDGTIAPLVTPSGVHHFINVVKDSGYGEEYNSEDYNFE